MECIYRAVGEDPLTNRRHTAENRCEIIQILSGKGRIMMKDLLCPFEAGAIYFIDAAEPHCSMPENPAEYVRSKLELDKVTLEGLCGAAGCRGELLRLYGRYVCPSDDRAREADRLFSELSTLSGEDGAARAKRSASLLRLLSVCFSQGEDEAVPVRDSTVSQVLRYISLRLAEPLTLDGICREFYVSKSYFCRLFRKTTGMTVMDYIRLRRLTLAARRLTETRETVSSVALSSGFTDLSYFSRLFRDAYGQSPSRYRKNKGQTPG